MPTPTTRLALLKPSTSDPFVTADIAANLQKIDDIPGYKPCTSSTRPSWSSSQAGMLIVETDTGLIWRFDGTVFKRVAPAGVLRTTSGGVAVATRTTDFSTSSTSAFVVALTLSNVVVPDGNRPLALILTGAKGENTNGAVVCSIRRGSTANAGTDLGTFGLVGDSTSPTAGAQGAGFTYVGWETAGVTAGTYSWTFQIRSSLTFGGTSYIRADSSNILRLVAVEL